MYKVVLFTSILLIINFIGCIEKTESDISRNMDERLVGSWKDYELLTDEYVFYSYGHVSYQLVLWSGSHDCETVNEYYGGGDINIYNENGDIKETWRYEIEDERLTLWTPIPLEPGKIDIHHLTKKQ